MPTNAFSKAKTVFYTLVIGLIVLFACSNYSHAATTAGYSDYYIPGDELSMWTILNTLDASGTTTMHCLISVTGWSDNTTIYYDHWENGLTFDPLNPAATADETYTLLFAGDLRNFESSNIPTAPRGTGTFYDGGDRIYVAGGAVTVTRSSWIEARGVGNQAVAWEIYPVKPQLTTYILPFGENLGFTDFARVFVLIQATENNTTFQVDLNGDGIYDTLNQNRNAVKTDPGDTDTVTLQRGQTFLLDRISACSSGVTCTTFPGNGNLNAGTLIRGNSTLQVKYVTGDVNWMYMARGFSAFPRGFWTKDYYAPLDEPSNARFTDYFLYNPNTSSITINWASRTGSGSFTVGANATVSFRAASGGSVPEDSGLYFKGSDVFWGVGVGDSTQDLYEWGFSLLPSTMLYDEHFLGWAQDSNPPTAGRTDNGVFLTVAQDNTRVFVDLNNDGTPDQIYTLDRLQTQYITAPSGNLTQTHFWATGPFTLAYGQNADTASTPAFGMDLGYVAIPATDFISLVLTVDKSVNPQVVPTASGSVATFTVKVNSQKYTVDGVNVTDYLPPNWQYLTGTDTTTITWPDKTLHYTDPSVSGAPATGQTLTWTSAQLGTNGTPGMAENQEITITFTARTTAVLATGTLSQNRVKAIGTRTFGTPSQTQTFTTTDFVYVASGNSQITKTSSATNPLYPGDQFTYTVTMTNPASATTNQTGISLYDPLPAGVSYVAGSSQVTGWRATPQTDNVMDTFSLQAYNNNNGSVNWASNWWESDATQNATADDVQIIGGQLRLGSTSNIYRQVNLSAATSATLSLNYSTSGNIDNGEWLYIEVASSPSGPWTPVRAIENDPTPNPDSVTNFNIPSSLFSPTTTIRFSTSGYDNNEYLYIDNVNISYVHTVTSFGTSAGGSAPDFVSSSDGYVAAPGQSLTLTYNVIVDKPLAAGINEITNTAYVNSNEIILPLSASVTNPVVNPSSGSIEVGDRVWLDIDGDGVQDVGEPGLANVEVTLKDQFGTPLMTMTTDSTGRYLFTGVVPGNGYYVEATQGTLPAGLQQSAPSGHTDNRTNPINLLVSHGNNRDNFGVRAYTNSNGTVSWTNPWVENDPGGGGATGGNIQVVTAVTPAELRINNSIGGSTYIYRNLNIPAGATMATFSFDWRTTGVEANDVIAVMISPDGTTYTTLYTFTGIVGTTSGHQEIDISSYLGAGTRIRFEVTAQYTGGDDYFFVDNVNVAYYSVAFDNYLDADLGYKAAPLSAIIGDLVWSDFNNNGLRDSGEVGLGGVTVRLYRDNNEDGVIDGGDTLVSTQTTAPDGSYLFSGITAGSGEDYLVSATTPAGYLPTGETQFRYINITGGSSYLNADFGYRGDTVTTYTITDRVWNDTDSDGVFDGGENGIAGVTIELLDASLNVIGTTTTAADGTFTFSGLAGGGADYTVRINDTGGVLLNYYGTTSYALALKRVESNLTASIDRVATPPPSYGFYPLRSIGDTVFNDLDGNGTQDAGDLGIAGVAVSLHKDINGDGIINVVAGPGTVAVTIGSTTVSGTGTAFLNYHAGEPITIAGVRFIIQSVTSNTLLTLTTNYTGATASGLAYSAPPAGSGTVAVTNGSAAVVGTGTTFTQYRAGEPITINNGGTANVVYTILSITNDTNLTLTTNYAGTTNGARAYFGPGDALLTSITTNATGNYLFSGLVNRSYIVSVPTPTGFTFTGPGTDSDAVTTGTQKGATIAGGVSVLDKDFGFQFPLATQRTVSGTIWNDLDADGVIDGGESLLAGVTVEVRRNCPAPCTLVATVTTDALGVYSVAGLVNDNSYTVRVTDFNGVLTGYYPTFEYGVGTAGPFDNQAPVDLTGGNVLNVNFGFKRLTPTLVTLSDFRAYEDNGKVVVEWATASEHGTAGFYLYRLDENKGDYIRLNHNLLPALLTSPQGGIYSLIDKGASVNAESITYLLVEMEGRGSRNVYGPFTVQIGGESVTGELNPDVRNLQLPGECTTCPDRQEKVSSSGITQYFDTNGILVVTNRKDGQKEQMQTDTGTDLFENYSRKAHEMSAAKKARIEAIKLAREATKSLMSKGNARVPATEKGKAKIAVAEKGLYYLNASEISTLFGISAQDVINMNNVSMSNQGQKVAYIPATNNTGIYFYGEGIDSIYTRENIYWLEKNRGLQMEIVGGAGPAPATGTETFTETLHLEEDHWAAPALFDDPQSDYWVWDFIVAGNLSMGSKTFHIKANGVAPSPGSATLAVNLKGGTNTSGNPDHHVVISLNGTTIGEDRWDGIEAHTLTLSFNQSLLNEGDNTLIVTGLLDTGAPYSIFYVESFDLSYQRYYKAVHNRLFARGDGNPVVTIEGFTDPAIFVFDVSNASKPKFITSATVDHPVADNYRVSFRPASPESLYLALTIDGLSTPVSVIVDKASNFKNTRNSADYLVIAPAELKSASQVLADYRQRQGLRTMVVDLEDIMDEFNYGIYSPEAIRDFLSYSYQNCSRAPRYVVLAGEGTFDYRNNQGYGDNLIPPFMTATPQGLFPSDNHFADVNGDHIPEMAIGRLPVATAAEMNMLISKIITYENSSGGTWSKKVLMLADNPDDGGDFPLDSNNVAALLPIGYTANKIYLSERSIDEARQLVLNGINSGALLINYIGHAGVDRLAQEGLLLTSDVASMTNQERLPLVTAMTCTVGQFAIPGYDSLSEVLLLKAGGGSVAVWSPTGMSINSEAVMLNEMFFKSAFTGTKQALGDVVLRVIKEGSMNGVSVFMLDIYNIMGDPALKLK